MKPLIELYNRRGRRQNKPAQAPGAALARERALQGHRDAAAYYRENLEQPDVYMPSGEPIIQELD